MESLKIKKQKKVEFFVMSDRKCSKCGKPLKQNLVNSTKNADKCYTCWMLSRGRKTIIKKKRDKVVRKIDLVDKQKNNKKKYLYGIDN